MPRKAKKKNVDYSFRMWSGDNYQRTWSDNEMRGSFSCSTFILVNIVCILLKKMKQCTRTNNCHFNKLF